MPIPIDFENFLGIHAGKTKPPRNSADLLENFDLRGLSGALEQRTGYNLMYDAKPLGIGLDVLTTNHLALESIYIPEVGGGKEIQIIVGNGIATSQQDNDAEYTKDVFCVWASHKYHPGSNTWTDTTEDGWDWLNEIVFTTVRAVHGTDKYKIRLDIVDASYITDDKFRNYSVLNIDTGEVYKIIGTFEYSATNNVGIYISSENHTFATGHQLALMRNYFPIDYISGNSDAVANDISFVKINNDLKIGFGGYENRVAVTVGYRKSFLNLKAINFATATLGPLEDNIVEIDGLVCNPHTALFDNVSIDLSVISEMTNPLTQQFYYFRLIGVLDGLSKVMLNSDAKIEIGFANKAIEFVVNIDIGCLNERLTDIEVYVGTDANLIVYQFLKNIPVRDDTVRVEKYLLNEHGLLISDNSTTELHSAGSTADDNAASTLLVGDPLTSPHWTCPVGTVAAIADAGAGSVNVLRFYKNNTARGIKGIFTPWNGDFEPNTAYDISLYLKLQTGSTEGTIKFFFENSTPGLSGSIHSQEVDNTYILYSFQVTTGQFPGFFSIDWNPSPLNCEFRIDRLSITKAGDQTIKETTEYGLSVSSIIGYTPDLNLVKSWDQGKLSSGKLLAVNAWINERNLNKIFFSWISGSGAATMWDAISALGYYDVDNSDGNDLKGIEILRNLDILTLSSNSNLRVDSATGRSLDLGIGSGTENIKAAVNLGDRIIYPGKFDILQTNGVQTDTLSFGTVSETYRALTSTHRGLMRAIREENKSSYRFYLGNSTSKEELILTPFGWQSAKRYLTPASYALKRDGTVIFLNSGYIYEDKDGSGDNLTAISSKWKSIPIDNELIPEMKPDDMIVVTDWWIFFLGTNGITMNLYLDYSGTAFDTQIISPAGSTKTKYKRPVKVKDIGPAVCSSFQLEFICAPVVVDTYGGGRTAGTIFSAGVLIEIIPGRLHA